MTLNLTAATTTKSECILNWYPLVVFSSTGQRKDFLICLSTEIFSIFTFQTLVWNMGIINRFNVENYQLSTVFLPGRVAQLVTCLATDACLTADPGVTSSIPARSHTFVEIDHEIISTVILLPSANSFKKGCCQLQAKVYAQITG